VEYAEKHGIPIAQSKKENLLAGPQPLAHQPRGRGEIEKPEAEPNWEACLTMTVPPEKAPDKAEIVSVDFEAGQPGSR